MIEGAVACGQSESELIAELPTLFHVSTGADE